VDFSVIDQLLIRYSAFVRYWRKNGSTMGLYMLFTDFRKVYDSVRRKVLYNIVTEYSIPIKLVRLNKMYEAWQDGWGM
jgi:hypothetical protein